MIHRTQELEAIERVVANCGESVRPLLLGSNALITAKTVGQLSRTSPERQRAELAKVRRGIRPFTTKSTVFDTTGYDEVQSRLARAGGKINKASQIVAMLDKLTDGDRRVLRDVAERIDVGCVRLRQLIELNRDDGIRRPSDASAPGYKWKPPRKWKSVPLKSRCVQAVLSDLNQAASFILKCVRDLGSEEHRVPPPSSAQIGSCCERLILIGRDLDHILGVLQQDRNAGRSHLNK